MKIKLEIDAKGLLCPLPVLKLRKKMESCTTGDILKIISDDPAAVIDIPNFCNENDYDLISSKLLDETSIRNPVREFLVKK